MLVGLFGGRFNAFKGDDGDSKDLVWVKLFKALRRTMNRIVWERFSTGGRSGHRICIVRTKGRHMYSMFERKLTGSYLE